MLRLANTGNQNVNQSRSFSYYNFITWNCPEEAAEVLAAVELLF